MVEPALRIGDGNSTNLADYVYDQMRADLQEDRHELFKFFTSGEFTTNEILPDSLPWLFVCGGDGFLPSACEQLTYPGAMRAASIKAARRRSIQFLVQPL